MKETYYNTRVWLNPEDSPPCGSLVCYDGVHRPDSDEPYRNMFVAVTDCYNTARLHKTSDDSIEDYAAKVRLMRDYRDILGRRERHRKTDSGNFRRHHGGHRHTRGGTPVKHSFKLFLENRSVTGRFFCTKKYCDAPTLILLKIFRT